jgi:hypothetical protein
MEKKIICLILFMGLFVGCTTGTSVREGRELYPYDNITSMTAFDEGASYQAFDPKDVESALPQLADLPQPSSLKRKKTARRYTGIIKNKTNYTVSVPSGDSDATLLIPAKGFIEYTAWAQQFDLTAYYNGKPFYCMKIFANTKAYPFMCKKYDFIIEIVKAEPRKQPIRKKKKIKKKKKDEGVKALG